MYSTQCWELIYGSREWKSLRTRYYSSHFVRFAFISLDKQGGGIVQLKCLPSKHIANDLHYGFKVHLSFWSPQPKSDDLVSNATTAHIFFTRLIQDMFKKEKDFHSISKYKSVSIAYHREFLYHVKTLMPVK